MESVSLQRYIKEENPLIPFRTNCKRAETFNDSIPILNSKDFMRSLTIVCLDRRHPFQFIKRIDEFDVFCDLFGLDITAVISWLLSSLPTASKSFKLAYAFYKTAESTDPRKLLRLVEETGVKQLFHMVSCIEKSLAEIKPSVQIDLEPKIITVANSILRRREVKVVCFPDAIIDSFPLIIDLNGTGKTMLAKKLYISGAFAKKGYSYNPLTNSFIVFDFN